MEDDLRTGGYWGGTLGSVRVDIMNTKYYLPGGNANYFTLRKEENYKSEEHGNGVVHDIQCSAEQAYKAVDSHELLVNTLESIVRLCSARTASPGFVVPHILDYAQIALDSLK